MTGVIFMKGDMVKFCSPEIFSSANNLYVSPGVVIDVEMRENFFGFDSARAKVYWADGRVTTEHYCYLKKISSVPL